MSDRLSVKVCDICGAQAADIGYACNHAQGGSARFKRIEVVPIEVIERHRQQIKARGAGRRISSVAADEELWAVLR